MIDFLIFYMIVGYAVNNIVGLIVLYTMDEDEVELDFMGFLLTIPVWPYTLFTLIQGVFSRD